MRFLVSDRMSSQFLHFFLLLPFVWTSENPASSGWAKMQISPDVLCSMPYGDFRLNIYEHVQNQMSTTPIGQKRYFYTPIALVDHKSAESKYNNATKLTEMHFRIEMWNDKVQSEMVNYLSDFIGQQIRSNQIQVIPFDKMILTTTKPSMVYSLSTNWLPYQLQKTFWFSLTCFDQNNCNQLQHLMHDNPTEFRHLKLLFSQSSQTSLTKEIVINSDNIVSSTMVSDLLKQCENSEFALLSSEDENRLLSEIKTNILVEAFENSEVISPRSEVQVYNALKTILMSKIETKQNGKAVDESVCWEGKEKETDSEVSIKIEEVEENEGEWGQFNPTTNTTIDYANLDFLPDVPAGDISLSSDDFNNSANQDNIEEDDKKSTSKTILQRKLNLGKLRNFQSVDIRPVKVRFLKAILSNFVNFVQFSKLSTTDEWAEFKKELKGLKNDHENLKTEYRNLKNDHQTLKGEYQNLKANHQAEKNSINTKLSGLKNDHENLKTEYRNLKNDHQTLKGEYQNLKANHQADKNSIDTKLSDFQNKLENSITTDISFSAFRNTEFKNENSYVPFDYTSLNKGMGLNIGSGKFIAPKGGTYLFTFHGKLSARIDQHLEIKLNGETKAQMLNDDYGYSYMETRSLSIVLSLNKNDIVGVFLKKGILKEDSYFYGILVHEKK